MAGKKTPDSWDLSQRWLSLPLSWWQMYWGAMETITYRVPMMVDGGLMPDARQRAENSRMVSEKMLAATQSMLAFWAPPSARLTQSYLQWWNAVLRADAQALESVQRTWLDGTWPQLLSGHALQVMEQGMRPWHEGATANARRLRRRGSRKRAG